MAILTIQRSSSKQWHRSRRPAFLKTSLLLSAISLAMMCINLWLSQQTNYTNQFRLFGLTVLGMLSAGGAALLLGLLGTWCTRGRSLPLWVANLVALSFAGTGRV